jgi:hypothetical protein
LEKRQQAQAGAGPQPGVGVAQRQGRRAQQGDDVLAVVRHFLRPGVAHGRTPAEDAADGDGAGVAVLFQPVGQHREPVFVVGAVDAGGGERGEVGHDRRPSSR